MCGAIVLSAPSAFASTIAVGEWVHFNGSLGSLGGGAFQIHDVSNSAVPDFLTFCVQETQYIDYTHDFRVGSITNDADDAAGPDPIEPETAWIMSNFSRGLLGAFSSNDIQWAIWKLEAEVSSNWGQSAALIGLAHTAVVGGWANDGVKVLNLFWANGAPAQDQLVYLPTTITQQIPNPEPGTIVLFTTGGLALAFARRRRCRAPRA
jgi:hypothetical protein